MRVIPTLLLALAVSADGFGVGMAYSVRKIKIPPGAVAIICAASMFFFALAMLLGHGLKLVLSPHVAEKIGGAILCLIGLWLALEVSVKGRGKPEEGVKATYAQLRIKPMGIIIQVLRDPALADLDLSGVIGYSEALLLGMALALDAFGVGLGASMVDFDVLMTTLAVGACKFLLISLGTVMGAKIGSGLSPKISGVGAGLLLFIMGLVNMR